MELKNTSDDVKFRVRTDGETFFYVHNPISGTETKMYGSGAQTNFAVRNSLFTWIRIA